MARETKSMTVYYCVGEKSAAICAEIGDRLRDLFAASLSTATLTTLAGLCVFGVCTFTARQVNRYESSSGFISDTVSSCPFKTHYLPFLLLYFLNSPCFLVFPHKYTFFFFNCTLTTHTRDNTTHQVSNQTAARAVLTSACPRQRDGQTDRKRESSRVYLRTDGELGQSAAQPLRDCLQLFQLRLLTPALLAQDLVLQPLVALSKTQHTCSKTQPCSHRCAAAPVSPGPVFKHVTLSPAVYTSARETQLTLCFCKKIIIVSSFIADLQTLQKLNMLKKC